MGQAVLTFFGVILGATIAGGIPPWQVQLVTRREREVRQGIREQESKDRRDAFQRETILALQDVMDMLTAYLRARDEKREADTKAGKWTRRDDLSPYPPDFAEASRHIYRLRARIFDDELRKLGWRSSSADGAGPLRGE